MPVLKDFFKNLFIYQEQKKEYDFVLPISDTTIKTTKDDSITSDIQISSDQSIYDSIDKNLDFLKCSYNSMINSDIILREFHITVKGKSYKALVVAIDGMVNSDSVNNFLLKSLMQGESKNTNNNISVKHKLNIKTVDKFNLEDYLYSLLIPQNSIQKVYNFSELISGVNSGSCSLIIDTLSTAFVMDTKGFETRSVSPPINESIIRGSQEGFTEKLRTNTSMLRRIINNENLIIENTKVGKITKKQIAICYIKGIVNPYLVSEVKYRLNNLDLDYIISSGQLEQLIEDNSSITVPEVIATERPDKTSHLLLEGRICVITDGTPYVLIMPAVLLDFLSSPEDMNLKHQYSNLLRTLRLFACFITLLLPGIYIAITTYHAELLPTELLFTIAASRESVPFPVIFEILLMELSFELVREAGLRVPNPIGPTIGIVGALILGDAAVSASLVSPILIIIVAITGICSFAVTDFSFSFSLRIFRFLYILLGYILGFLGIAIGIFIHLSLLSNLKSFGVPYLSPYVPNTSNPRSSLSYFLHPIWKREKRAEFLNTKRPILESKISMKWKFGKNSTND